MKKYGLLISVLFCLSGAITAQTENTGLKGRLLDDQGQAVAFANVILYHYADSSMAKATFSEEDGTFQFTFLQKGNYYARIVITGYENKLVSGFTIPENEIHILEDIQLTPVATGLDEVVVKTTRPIVEVKPDKTVFNVEGSINATGHTALELLRKAPGVVVDNNERLMVLGKSGVKVYIDGKQSILAGDDLANYLKTLQSSQIESIEIITQPSSKYEAEGNAGIINIRLIKNKSMGTNMLMSLSHNQATHGRSNVNTNLNTRTEKLNVFGNINYAGGANSDYNIFERTTPDLYTYQENNGINHWSNFSLRGGADVSTGANSTFGVLFDGYHNDGPSENNIESTLSPYPGASPTDLLAGYNSSEMLRESYNINGNYRYDNRQGSILNADLDYGLFESTGSNFQPNYYFDPITDSLTDTRIFSNNTLTTIDIKTLKLDYEKPIWGGVIGAGTKLAKVETDNVFEFYDVIEDMPVLNTEKTNSFSYEENINAGYINFNRQWKKIGIQAGARIEWTDSKGELTSLTPDNGETVAQDYVDLFPSGGLSYQLDQKNTFSLNFSRRIDRPGYQDLNPFEFKLDELTYQKGNPFLKPQYTNNVQINHTFNYTLNTSLSFSHTNDLMAPLTDTAGNGAVFLTTENIAEQDLIVLNLSYPFAPAKAWNIFFNTSLIHKHNEGDFGDGKIVDITATTFNFYAQNTFILPMNFTFEISGWYNSPGIWGGNFATTSMWSIDAGIQKKFWDDRATFKVSIADIFKSQTWSGMNTFGDLMMQASGGWESRELKLNFTYAFGNTEIKSSRDRKTGLEEESSRIK